jgi:aspartate racemase
VDDLARAVRRLRTEAATPSADFAVIVCNAAHAWLAELRRRVELPILDMPGEALRVAVTLASEGTSIGLLGTSATLDSGIYPEALERLGHRPRIITLYDVKHEGHDGARLHEDLVMSPIYGPMKDGQRVGGGIKSGRLGPTSDGVDPGAQLRRAVELLGRAGASVVITACTEIPLALGRVPVEGIPLIDPMQVAATESIAIASGSRPLP